MKRALALLIILGIMAGCWPVCAEEPLLTEDGFLNPDWEDDEFVWVDEEAGQWHYFTPHLSIRIDRFIEEDVPRVYYVADIRCSQEEPLKTVLTDGKKPGRSLKNPRNLAIENQAVFAITDDFSGYRIQRDQRVGIVIREGYVLGEKTRSSDSYRGWPNLDTLAVYADGHMEAGVSDAHTAEEYLEMGATNVFAFGPMLVSDGVIPDFVLDEDYYPYHEPRLAIGMIEPFHYIVLCVEGRSDDSKGARPDWMAKKMLELGCVEALNLDGGGTAAIMFMGEVLNRSSKNMRSVNSLIVFGQSDLVGQEE